MNKREAFARLISGRDPGARLWSPHWWGVYKFEFSGYPESREAEAWSLSGRALADVDTRFYEAFDPDWLHLSAGRWSEPPRDAAHRREVEALRPRVAALESRDVIDAYIELTSLSEREIIQSGSLDHLPILRERHGGEAPLMLNDGNPTCYVLDPGGLPGFVQGMMYIVEKPDLFAYWLYRLCERKLAYMRALKVMGADGYIGSETFCSVDLISPAHIRALILPALRMFYGQVREMGLISAVYYLGDVMPIVEDIAQLGAHILLVEEGKKGFTLDVGAIYRKLDGRMALFGNVDSVHELLRGTRQRVFDSARRQLDATGPLFVTACGSPLAYGTAPENILALRDAARE